MINKSKTTKTLIIILIIPLIAEVFFFNFRFWESLFFKKQIDCLSIKTGNCITVPEINEPVKNIHIDLSESGINKQVVHLKIHLFDEANSDLELPVTEAIPQIKESSYIRIYPEGKRCADLHAGQS